MTLAEFNRRYRKVLSSGLANVVAHRAHGAKFFSAEILKVDKTVSEYRIFRMEDDMGRMDKEIALFLEKARRYLSSESSKSE